MAITIQNDFLRYVIGEDGRILGFIDRRTGEDYCDVSARVPVAVLRRDGAAHVACLACLDGEGLRIGFEGAAAQAVVRLTARPSHLVLEVESLEAGGIEEFLFLNVPLTLRGQPGEAFAACALALNLRTNVPDLPGLGRRLRALCYPRFGLVGAKAAVIGCPPERMRGIMQEVVSGCEEIPRSPLGGPWALDAPAARGSYLMNFGGVTEETVGEWIALMDRLGFRQLDFHGGSSFRFGDCEPNPEMYPRGRQSLRAVVDRLHAAGIMAGLHTYAFFIDKRCHWVTPVPDPGLRKDAVFTLARPLGAEDDAIEVLEPTVRMSAVTGFFVRNSVLLQVGGELIAYREVRKEPPYGFSGCTRGALGTRASAHPRGARVEHLAECFGLLAPDGDSALLKEVAESTARTFNECGFDMMYLDALDGEDVLGGAENGWHYGSKFVFDLCRRLHRPALLEMSTFHHHLWYVRSRIGAWDHPRRAHKKFVDLHCAANDPTCGRGLRHRRRGGNVDHHAFSAGPMLLPAHLGWWALLTGGDPQQEPTFRDDLEYLCTRCLGTDAGFSLVGLTPEDVARVAFLTQLADVAGLCERLRLSGAVPAAVKARLRRPGAEFALRPTPDGGTEMAPARHVRHAAAGGSTWRLYNRFAAQPLRVRVEALPSVAPFDGPEAVTLFDPVADAGAVAARSADGVSLSLAASPGANDAGPRGAALTAASRRRGRAGSWGCLERTFDPPLDLGDRKALGVWVHGDAGGYVLNFQLRSPQHVSTAIGEHYVVVDFAGWRYFELVEPDADRYADYVWPYGDAYSIYRESVDYHRLASLSIWCNNLPRGREVRCGISAVKALPLMGAGLSDPRVEVDGNAVAFPCRISAGGWLEFESPGPAALYAPTGERLADVSPDGAVPTVPHGGSIVKFSCCGPPGGGARGRVALTMLGRFERVA